MLLVYSVFTFYITTTTTTAVTSPHEMHITQASFVVFKHD